MPVQLKIYLHLRNISVMELYEAMYLRGHDVTYKEIARYCRCYGRDVKPRWNQIETCLKEYFGIEMPW